MSAQDEGIYQQLGGIVQRLDDLKETIGRVEQQTTKTNGRVTALEDRNAREDARAEAFAEAEDRRIAEKDKTTKLLMWGGGLIVALLSGALGTLLTVLLGVHPG